MYVYFNEWICMYVCMLMYVCMQCMYVYMRVSKYVYSICMSECMYECMYVFMRVPLRMISLSLQVPVSDSSALTTRKEGRPSDFLGMNDHFRPEGKPAPPECMYVCMYVYKHV